jgi:hypothetical protein
VRPHPLARNARSFLASEEAGWAALGVAAAAVAVAYLLLTRGMTFWVDDLSFYLDDKGFDPRYLFTAHNGQLIVVPRLIYAVVFDLFGPNYLVLRFIHLVGILLVGTLVYALLKRRVPWTLALAPALLIMLFGSSWKVAVPATGIINVYCVAAGLGAMLALERAGRWADPLAALLIAISLGAWSAGLAFAAGAAVLILRSPGWRRRAWVVVAPLGLYALWWLLRPAAPGDSGLTFSLSNVFLIPNFTASSLAATLAAVTGLDYGFNSPPVSLDAPAFPPTDYSWGPALAVLAIACVVIALRRTPVVRWPWAWIAALLAFWVTTSMTFSTLRTPTTDRFHYVAAALIIVLAADLLGRRPLGARAKALVVAAVVFSLGANVALFDDGAKFLREYGSRSRAQLAAIELARSHVNPGFHLAGSYLTTPLALANAGDYLAAADRIGSIGESIPALRAAPEADREAADQVLVGAYGLHVVRAGTTPSICRKVTSSHAFQFPRGGAVLRTAAGGAAINLRRFGDAFSAQVGPLSASRYEALRIPPDAARDPWWGQSSTPAPLAVCRL